MKTAEMIAAETTTIECVRRGLARHVLLDLPATVAALPLSYKLVCDPRADVWDSRDPKCFLSYFLTDAEIEAAL
jgi:hypothetical protein